MKVVFICGAGIISGKEIQTIHTMVQLKKMGHEVSCIMASWGSPDFAKLLDENGIPHISLRLGFISKTLSFSAIRMTLHQAIYLPSLWLSFRKYIRSVQPSVIIHTNFHHVFLLLPVLKKGKHVFYSHDPFPPSRFFKALFRRFDKKISLFIGVSNFIAKGLIALGLDEKKVVCVYNGIRESSPPGKAETNTSIRTIGIVGQVGEWKGHEDLIAALIPILQRRNDVQLRIVGSGDPGYVEKLKQVTREKHVDSKVIFTGRISGLANIYRGIDIICLPSKFQEPFGLTAVEAMSFKIPVVCYDTGGLPEIVVNNSTGYIVPAGDINTLRERLAALIDQPTTMSTMGDNGYGRFIQSFTIEQSTAELLIHLQKVVKS